MREFTIRLATKKDIRATSKFATPVIKALKFYNKACTARNLYEVGIKDLKANLKENKNNVIIAVAKEGDVVGLCTHFVGLGHVDWLDWLLVDEKFRKNGVGRALVDYAVRNAKKRGCHKIWCDSNPKNRPALKFFPRMGFRKVGTLRRHSFQQDQVLWEKFIK